MNETLNAIIIKDFTKLKVWSKSFEACKDIYAITNNFPAFETYALKSQIIRSCTSISGNLCEGSSQIYNKKKINFYNNALGSTAETRNWLMIALQQSYITQSQFEELDSKFIEITKMIIGCMRKVQLDMKYESTNSDLD